jgi:2'-5' RNA ligase
MDNSPLILTLTLDNHSQQYFNALRKEHFPPERNYLDAHLTLFHHLPANEPQLIIDIEALVKQYNVLKLQVAEIKSIGNGLAYKLECSQLLNLHKQMQQQWEAWLIPQDRQKLWPHITIQNKVDPAKAQLLKTQLDESFKPFEAVSIGLSLFEYQGGPWEFVRRFEFGESS